MNHQVIWKESLKNFKDVLITLLLLETFMAEESTESKFQKINKGKLMAPRA